MLKISLMQSSVEQSLRSRSVALGDYSRKGSRSPSRMSDLEPQDLNAEELKNFKEIRMILSVPSFKRTSQQIAVLVKYLLTLQEFKDIKNKESEEAVVECAKYLNHMSLSFKTFQLEKEGEPSRFFIILSGRVRLYQNSSETSFITLTKNSTFGQGYFLTPLQYQQAVCISATHFAVLDAVDFKKIHDHALDKKFQIVLNFLYTIPILRALSRKYIHKILTLFSVKLLKRKEFLFKEREKVDFVYFVENGEFLISRKSRVQSLSPSRISHEPVAKNFVANEMLAIVGKGELLGDEDVLFQKPLRSFNCECYSDSGKILMISNVDFFEYLAKSNDVVETLKQRISLRNRSREGISRVNSELLKLRLPKPQLPLSPVLTPRSNTRQVLIRSGHSTPRRQIHKQSSIK